MHRAGVGKSVQIFNVCTSCTFLKFASQIFNICPSCRGKYRDSKKNITKHNSSESAPININRGNVLHVVQCGVFGNIVQLPRRL